MIEPQRFVDLAFGFGYGRYASVACSILTPLIKCATDDSRVHHTVAHNEGDAVAIAAGNWIGGTKGIAMMQNSGLGNAVNPLTSLAHTFGIPILLVCTHRGASGTKDAPQHEQMGAITTPLLDLLDIPWAPFPSSDEAIVDYLSRAEAAARSRTSFTFVVPKGALRPIPFIERQDDRPPSTRAECVEGRGHLLQPRDRPTRAAVIESILSSTSNDSSVTIATTGYTGRELYVLDDRPSHFYMVGSMGCASSVGLGLAQARPDLRVLVIDGDGAILMRLGNIATIGAHLPRNLVHIVLDNEMYESTGAQRSDSESINFAQVAKACGYARTISTDCVKELEAALAGSSTTGPLFAHVKTSIGTPTNLPRPELHPAELVERLQSHIGPRPRGSI